jgi:drug/metabolite transporter, DME family
MTSFRAGLLLGALSAIGYAAANSFLRGATSVDAAWVSAVKSFWLIALLGPPLTLAVGRGEVAGFGRRSWIGLIAAGCIGQFGGNLAFQWGLERIGLSVTVPLCLGAMICSSALIQRLSERVPLRRNVLASIPIFLVAMVLLSVSRSGGTAVAADRDWQAGVLGSLAAAASGVSYSILGFAIRRATGKGAPVSLPMVIVGVVGLVGLGSLGLSRLGIDGVRTIDGWSWGMMTAAGLANAAAFLSLSLSLRAISVLYVHLLNSTQVALTALVGSLFFGEAFGGLTIAGVLLTIVGFIGMAREPRRPTRSTGEGAEPSDQA